MGEPERIRVWHLLSNRWNSAVTEYALSAARALRMRGYDNVFTPLQGSPGEERARGIGLETMPMPSFKLGELPRVMRVARQVRPNIILTYGGPEDFAAAAMRKTGRLRIPSIRFRGDIPRQGRVREALQWLRGGAAVAGKGADGCSTLFPSRAARASYGARYEDCPVIPLGIDGQKFSASPDPLDYQAPRLLVFGRLDPVKGHAELLEIFARMLSQWPKDQPKPQLIIAGKEANLTVEELEVRRRHLDIDVRLVQYRIGQIADPAALMTAVTLGVVSSLGSELICRVAEEFLLCGTPVFGSGVGSLEEVAIDPSRTRGFPSYYSYKNLSVEEAARGLKKALLGAADETPETRRTRAAAAQEEFSLAAMGIRLDALVGGTVRGVTSALS